MPPAVPGWEGQRYSSTLDEPTTRQPAPPQHESRDLCGERADIIRRLFIEGEADARQRKEVTASAVSAYVAATQSTGKAKRTGVLRHARVVRSTTKSQRRRVALDVGETHFVRIGQCAFGGL